ncbi:conserved Plasmodium protein, unknown function [Plasmodium berghei]|uniref:Uncharacterized protein n=1 Tax=Plasmodium berghei TaxID=5821 RepID=A0A0Y9WSN1_PLABE|nr:conserved Plasmodium protein, unknown function [Plasmodium berghei]
MHFIGNEKNVNNTGLIYTTLEIIKLNDLIKFAKSEKKNGNDEICYLKYFSKNKKLNNLEKILNNNIVNSQVILTNFTENNKDFINTEYIYGNVVKNKTSYLMRKVYLSTFFTSDYINNICKEYKQVLINCDSKYHNKIYIDNNYIYFCINDLTKLSLITHTNLYKDKHGLSNVIMIDLNNSVEIDEKNKWTYNQDDGNVKDSEKKKKKKKKINHIYEKVSKTNENNNKDSENYKIYNLKYKMREIYKTFFSEFNTYPVNLIGTYDNNNNNNNNGFINKLNNIFLKNKNKDAKIYPIHLEYHETTYKGNSDDISLNNSIYQGNYLSNSSINNNTNINILNQLNTVTDIYKDIFSTCNLSNSLTTSFEYNMENEIDKSTNLSFSKNQKSNNFYYELDIDFIHNNLFSLWEKNKITNNKFNESFNYPIIRDDIYYPQNQSNHNTQKNTNINNHNNINDGKTQNSIGKKGNMHYINNKTFYINTNFSDSSDDSLLEFSKIKREERNNNKQIKNHKQVYSNGLINNQRNTYNNDNILNDKNDQNFENAKYSNNRKHSIDLGKKQYSELIQEYKNRKVQKILDFLRTYRDQYFINDEIFLEKESLLKIMDYNTNKTDLSNIINSKMDEKKEEFFFDEFINYLVEYIGKIHFDIKIKFKDKSKIFLKEKQNKNPIQKIILNNGLINSSNISNIFNFLLNQLLKKDNIQNISKLHYAISMHRYEYNFVNSDKNFKEMSTQPSLHLFMISSNGFLYLILTDTRNRIS